MRPYLAHPREEERLSVLYALGILDTPPDPAFDAITEHVAKHLSVPISTISVLDKEREWFKSRHGFPFSEIPRENAFCSWALVSESVFVVEDTLKDGRFFNNLYVAGEPRIRFYAGVALYEEGSHLPVGVLSVKDHAPHTLGIEDIEILLAFAMHAETLINKFPNPKKQ